MVSMLANRFSWFGFKWKRNAPGYELSEFRLHRFRWFLSLLRYSNKNLILLRSHKRLMGGRMSLNVEPFVTQSNWLKQGDEDDDDDSLGSSLVLACTCFPLLGYAIKRNNESRLRVFFSFSNKQSHKNCLAEPFAQHKPNENVRSRAPTTSVWVGLVAICWRDGSLAYWLAINLNSTTRPRRSFPLAFAVGARMWLECDESRRW